MAEYSNISSTAFDGTVAWTALPAHVQARIGAAAVELGVAMAISEHARMPACRAEDEAMERAGELLREAVVGYDGVPEGAWWAGTGDEASVFSIPSVLGMVCQACSCSQLDPCPGGCSWHSGDLCTACVPNAGIATAAPLRPGDVVVDGMIRPEPPMPVQPLGRRLGEIARAIDGIDQGGGDER